MAIDRTISTIGVDSGADNGKYPVYNSTTKVFDMTTPSGGGAWTEVANATVNGANNFTISGLTGNSVNMYKIIIKVRFTTADYIRSVRVNADSSALYQSNYSNFEYIGGAFTTSSAAEANDSGIRLGIANNFKNHLIEILIKPDSAFPRTFQCHVTSQDTGTATDTARFENYAIYNESATELTSIRFASNGGNNFVTGTEYWVLKLN